jgi:hypothetical protein
VTSYSYRYGYDYAYGQKPERATDEVVEVPTQKRCRSPGRR